MFGANKSAEIMILIKGSNVDAEDTVRIAIEKHGILDEGMLVAYSERCGVFKHIPEALAMFKKGKIVLPWSMPKSKNLDEIKKLIKISSTAKF